MKSKALGGAWFAAAMAGAGALSGPAAARALEPGLWTLGGVQEICLLSGGTWYSPTFPRWTGAWSDTTASGDQGLIQGTYPAPGAADGADSILVRATRTATWTEWRDYIALVGVLEVKLSAVSRTCGPPAAARGGRERNPMD